ncbi:hypothetical protein BH10PSE19_BH10PSE19_08650 [soil metagenome]
MNLKLSALALSIGLICIQTHAAQTEQTNPNQPNAATTQSMTQNNAVQNKQTGEKFLEQNKAKPGVVTTQSNLQYKILKAGHGEKPGIKDTVTVEYEGKLIDGTVFDSTKKHGRPASFPVAEVIPGWVEAIQLMPVGSEWELYIPAPLAYGENAPAEIGPNQALIFTVKLLGVKKGS